MKAPARLSPILSGVAGEYFVAAELSRRGYTASLTLRNTKGVDILAANSDATRSVGIQVKTNQGRGRNWLLRKSAEDAELADNLLFVFVCLNDGAAPSYHIVPREEVAQFIRKNHQRWLRTPARNGRAHKDTAMRKFIDNECEYLDRWDLLGLD